jgi:Trk-type K+ transport system membrane component
VFGYACFFIVVFELVGAALLFLIGPPMGQGAVDGGLGSRLGHSLFHAVSAFCNAGFSSFPEGLAVWRNHGTALMVVNVLVVGGGIGLITLIQLRTEFGNLLKVFNRDGRLRLVCVFGALLCCWWWERWRLWSLSGIIRLQGMAMGQRVSLALVHSVMLGPQDSAWWIWSK